MKLFSIKKITNFGLSAVVACSFGLAPALAADNDASSSLALEVPEGFDFASHQTVHLNIVANDEYGTPIEGAMIKIYEIHGKDRQVSFNPLFIGRTTTSGWLNTEAELPQHIKDVKVEISALGYAYSFTQDISIDNRLSKLY